MNDEEIDEETYEFTDFLREAIGVILESEDADAFLTWMREGATEQPLLLFAELPDDDARRSFAAELGRSLWNVIPLPGNSFRTRPLPQPERNDPCPCGSGRKYKKCCAAWSDVPALDPEAVWVFLVEELAQEQVEELGKSGQVPRHLVGELAAILLDDGDAMRALALVEPLFERPERLDERDAIALDALLQAYDDLELEEDKQAAMERLAAKLKPPLRAVLWEYLVRSHAMEGELEEAWAALEKARRDDPESVALGPMEVSLLMAEGRTQEAGERARFFRDRLRRMPEAISEAGLEFLGKVADDPDEAQLEFTLGKEVAARLHRLEDLLARAEPPAVTYELEETSYDPSAGWLVPPISLQSLEEDWDEVFAEPLMVEEEDWEEDDLEDEDQKDEDPDDEDLEDEDWEEGEEDYDPWDEERAEGWLDFVLDHPAALDSLAVLSDLSFALSKVTPGRLGSLDRRLLRPILDRGVAILRQTLAGQTEFDRLPDTVEANWPAYALITGAAEQAERLGEPERARELRDWLSRLSPESAESDDELF